MQMEWNVYYENSNKKKIVVCNIFDFEWFDRAVKKHLQDCTTKEDFSSKLQGTLNQHFCGFAQWETVIGPLIGDFEKEAIKIDVYDQVMLNWKVFLDYVWSFQSVMRGE